MKIFLYTIDSRFRASARHGGAGTFFEFCLPIPAQEAPSGTAAIIVSEGESGSNPRIYLNPLIFMITSMHSRGFHPRRCGFPSAITPELVLRHPRSAQGRYGWTGTVPSFIVPASGISYQGKRNSPEPLFFYSSRLQIRIRGR